MYARRNEMDNKKELKKQLLTEEELDKVAGGSDSSFQQMPTITGDNKPEDIITPLAEGKKRKMR